AGDQPQRDTGEQGQRHGDDDDAHRGAGTPDDAGEHVVAAHGRAPDVGGTGRLLGTEPGAVLVRHLRVAVRGDERCQGRGQQHERADDEAGDEHAALQAHGLADVADDGQALEDVHQYLTRGSMSAEMTSTMKFVTATMTASTTTMPCTATKSRLS